MALDLVRLLVGNVPVGFEFMEYVLASVVSIFVIYTLLSVFTLVFDWING